MTPGIVVAGLGLLLTALGGLLAAQKTREFRWSHLREPAYAVLVAGLVVGVLGLAMEATTEYVARIEPAQE